MVIFLILLSSLFQDALLRPLQFTTPDCYALDRAMLSFLQRRVVEKCDPSFGPGFLLQLFSCHGEGWYSKSYPEPEGFQ